MPCTIEELLKAIQDAEHDLKAGKNNDFIMKFETTSANAILVKIIDKSQKNAAIPKFIFHPNIVLELVDQKVRHSKQLEESIEEVFKITDFSIGVFARIGKSTVNLYGPYQQRFSVEPNERHKNNHSQIKKTIDKLMLLRSIDPNKVCFEDFQIVVRTILCAKWCAKCLEAILTKISISNSKLNASSNSKSNSDIFEFVKCILSGYENKVLWVDEQGNAYPTNSYWKDHPQKLIIQKSHDFTDLDRLEEEDEDIQVVEVVKIKPSSPPPIQHQKTLKKPPKEPDSLEEILADFIEKLRLRSNFLCELEDEERVREVREELRDIQKFVKLDEGSANILGDVEESDDEDEEEEDDDENVENEEDSSIPTCSRSRKRKSQEPKKIPPSRRISKNEREKPDGNVEEKEDISIPTSSSRRRKSEEQKKITPSKKRSRNEREKLDENDDFFGFIDIE